MSSLMSHFLQIAARRAEYLYNQQAKVIMSMNQTTASGERLTMLCDKGEQSITQRQADSWLRQRQASNQLNPSTQRVFARV